LIHDLPTYNLLISNDTPFYDLKTIYNSIITKNKIVLIDKKEQKERKSLNYGHTLGHAIESYFLNSEHKLLHGEAVSIGIVLASFLSYKLFNFSIDHVNSIKKHINCIYKKIEISESQIGSIIDLLIHDKKNSHGKINFILLKEIAEPVYDIQVKKELIKESFKYYLS
jgi:3-dehydroquinate synthase